MATLAIPEFRDEGSGGNAGASRTRIRRKCWSSPQTFARAAGLERSASPESITFRRAPDSNLESGLCFLVA